jgi:hypothetical protein
MRSQSAHHDMRRGSSFPHAIKDWICYRFKGGRWSFQNGDLLWLRHGSLNDPNLDQLNYKNLTIEEIGCTTLTRKEYAKPYRQYEGLLYQRGPDRTLAVSGDV